MNRIVVIGGLVLIGLFAHNANGEEKKVAFSGSPSLNSLYYSSLDEKILKEVDKYLGVRYLRGGSSKRGVDCSGFVRLIYRNVFEIDLPCIATDQCTMSILKKISVSELKTGDLIFFSPTIKKKKINHVGIYLSDGDFAHSIRRKGVIISNLEDRHWKSRISSTKRLINLPIEDKKVSI